MVTKILLPYYNFADVKITENKIVGGVEKFVKSIYDNFEVILVEFTPSDRKKRLVTKKILRAITIHKPDIIITNYDSDVMHLRVLEKIKIPVLWITHTNAGGISRLGHCESMHKLNDLGGSVAMVSKYQYGTMNKLSHRIADKDLDVVGYIHPSFCENPNIKVETSFDYDAVTIGRIDITKNPFWLPIKLREFDFTTRIFTTKVDATLVPKQMKYYEDNKHWPMTYDLPHDKLMLEMSKSRYYVSTCKVESYGITAQEALLRGLKVILVTCSNLSHASEMISPDPSYIIKIKGNAKPIELAEIISQPVDIDERHEISRRTIEKFQKDAWKKTLQDLIDKTIDKFKNRAVLDNENLYTNFGQS